MKWSTQLNKANVKKVKENFSFGRYCIKVMWMSKLFLCKCREKVIKIKQNYLASYLSSIYKWQQVDCKIAKEYQRHMKFCSKKSEMSVWRHYQDIVFFLFVSPQNLEKGPSVAGFDKLVLWLYLQMCISRLINLWSIVMI